MHHSLLVAVAILALSLVSRAAPGAIPPESVAVLYNSSQDSSRKLALHYALRRNIPLENLVALELSEAEVITRDQYNETLRIPLSRSFKDKKWWTLKRSANGVLQPVTSKIRVLVCMSGVPVKIARVPVPPPEGSKNPPPPQPSIKQDEASVDSELSLLGFPELPIEGPLKNPYFKSETALAETPAEGMLLVGRIDAPTLDTCKRMIDDAVAIERDGLWGMCYLDLARKGEAYKAGDDWIQAIADRNGKLGIPTIIDRNRDTFVTNYPMTDAALYFGWYTLHCNGPFLNPGFSFKKGAVAVHLHSFSASQLRQSTKYWCGPILERGAAATLGNVYEPFLQMTHDFDIFHDRLLQGFSLIEAAYMSIPVVSWQGVVLGDPLYRPYAAFTDFADFKTSQPGWEYKACRQAYIEWGNLEETRVTKLRSAAARHHSGLLYEALGLFFRQSGEPDQAAAFFFSAAKNYQAKADQLRQELHLVDMDREAGRKQEAITRLRTIKETFAGLPEARAVTGLLNILDPPAPPPAEIEAGDKTAPDPKAAPPAKPNP